MEKKVNESGKGFNSVVLKLTEKCGNDAVCALSASIDSAKRHAAETDDRYKLLQKDFICAKQRFEAKQLDVLNNDLATLKAFKRAVFVVVTALAVETETAAWFNYRALYKLGYLDKMPKEVNTVNKLAAFVRDTFADILANQKRKAAADSKENAIASIAAKYSLPLETARAMYIAGALKV